MRTVHRLCGGCTHRAADAGVPLAVVVIAPALSRSIGAGRRAAASDPLRLSRRE